MGATLVIRGAVSLVLLLAALSTLWAAPGGVPAAKPLGCLIEPNRIADVGSQVVGVVAQFGVERGDTVKAGQLLVTLHSEVERANAGVANSRASVDADVLAAQASLTLAKQKMVRAESLLAANFVSEQAVEQASAELELARQKLAQSRSQQRIWADERRVAQAQLALRSVRSPFAGIVVERFVNQGERVEEKPMLRLAAIDPLRVELMVPTAQYGAITVGDSITIRPELPGVEPVSAIVSHVDTVLDAASNSFRVRLLLPNPNKSLPAGLRCKADLPATAATKPALPPTLRPAAAVAQPTTKNAL